MVPLEAMAKRPPSHSQRFTKQFNPVQGATVPRRTLISLPPASTDAPAKGATVPLVESTLPDDTVAHAHALFRLAQFLLRKGHGDEAALHFSEASRLHPESWTIWRQGARKDANGLAAGPDFRARVDALGDRPYYRSIDMKGI